MTLAVRERSAERLFEPGEERSLDDLVTTVWGAVSLRGSARCLVCGATATRSADQRENPAADCPSCGSKLE